METGGSATVTLNAADEIAVEAFLEGKIAFPGIAHTISETIDKMGVTEPGWIGEVLEIDRASREAARAIIASRGQGVLTGAAVRA